MQKKENSNHQLTRRDFLKTSAKAGVLFGFGYPLLSESGKAAKSVAVSATDLAVVKGNPEKAVLKAIDLVGGMKQFVKEGQRVVIKPNMSFAKTPEEAANTNPVVVATVAQACRDAGATQVLVLDHTLQQGDLCIEKSGIGEFCQSIKGTYVLALNDEGFYQTVNVPRGKVIRELKIMKEILKSEVLINLPTAKSHSATGVSVGMKGLMGVIWDRGYFHSQVDLHQAIADLTSLVMPNLTIIDASRVLASGGPSGPGTVEKLNTIIAGVDPVAVDAYGVTITKWFFRKFEPAQIKHLLAAHQMGLGNINLNQLQISKETV